MYEQILNQRFCFSIIVHINVNIYHIPSPIVNNKRGIYNKVGINIHEGPKIKSLIPRYRMLHKTETNHPLLSLLIND